MRMPGVAPWENAGNTLRLDCRFRGFPEAIRFVNEVARLAEEANHHPDFTIRWNRVTLDLSTHSAGGLTAKDFDLAAGILEVARAAEAQILPR